MNRPIIECRGLIILCILIFEAGNLCAQETQLYYTSECEISTGKNSLGKSHKVFFAPNSIFWFTNDEWNSTGRQLKIFSTEYSTKKTDSIMLLIPDKIEIEKLPTISINDDYLILTDDYDFNLYLFVKENGIYTYKNRIITPRDSPVNSVTAINKDLFLFECLYNFHPDENQFNTNLAIYDASKNKLSKFIHPDLPCIAFSHLEKQWTAVSKSVLALASPCGYKIYLYDLNLNLKDSICHAPPGWKDVPALNIPFETNPSRIHPKLLIDKLLGYQDTISRIEKIFFIDDTSLFVSGINGDPAMYRTADLWNLSDLSKPLCSTLQRISYNDTDTIHAKKELAILNSMLNYTMINGRAIIFNDDNFFLKDNQLFRDFKNQKDNYYENHDPQFSIGIYKINIPRNYSNDQ